MEPYPKNLVQMLVSYLYTGVLERPARNELELFEQLLQEYSLMPNYYHYKSTLDSKGTDKHQKHGTRGINYEIIGNREAEKVFPTSNIGHELGTAGIMKHKSAYNIENYDTKVSGDVDNAEYKCTDIVDSIDHTRKISGRSNTNYSNSRRINKDDIKEELGTCDIMEHKAVYNIENDDTKGAGDNVTHGCTDIVDSMDDKRAISDKGITNNFNSTSTNKDDDEDEYNYISSDKIDAVLEHTNDDIDGGEGAEEIDISNADKCKNVDHLDTIITNKQTTITNKGDDETEYNYESHDDKIDEAVLVHADNDINDDVGENGKNIGEINNAEKSKNVDHSGDPLPLNYLFSISVPHMKLWGDSKSSALGPTVDNLTEQNANKSKPKEKNVRKQKGQNILGKQSNLQNTEADQKEERPNSLLGKLGNDFDLLLQNMADRDQQTKTKPKEEPKFKMESPNQPSLPSCSDCNQSFESYTDLNKHICQAGMDSFFPLKTRACNKKKVFYCPMCNKGCSDLNEHNCDMEMDFVFHKKKKSLKKKVLSNKKKVYYCPECNEGCPSRKELTRHMYIHNGENKCPLCGKTFPRKADAASHLQSHVRGK